MHDQFRQFLLKNFYVTDASTLLDDTSLMDSEGSGSLSMMVPVPLVEPMVKGTVSAASLSVSLTVGRVTVKPVTPGGTVNTPPERVTPLLKVAVV